MFLLITCILKNLFNYKHKSQLCENLYSPYNITPEIHIKVRRVKEMITN